MTFGLGRFDAGEVLQGGEFRCGDFDEKRVVEHFVVLEHTAAAPFIPYGSSVIAAPSLRPRCTAVTNWGV